MKHGKPVLYGILCCGFVAVCLFVGCGGGQVENPWEDAELPVRFPEIGYHMLGSGSFHSHSDGGDYYIDKVPNYNEVGNYLEQGSDEVDLFAPIQLPDGARITNMTYYYNDSTSDGYTLAELVRCEPGSHDDYCDLILFAMSGNNEAPGDETKEATEPIQSIQGGRKVDNSKYLHMVHIVFAGVLEDHFPLRAYGVLIEYIY